MNDRNNYNGDEASLIYLAEESDDSAQSVDTRVDGQSTEEKHSTWIQAGISWKLGSETILCNIFISNV